jgi:protein phosphatase
MNLLNYGAGSNIGNIRSLNEDFFSTEPELGLWIVADGMGGHQGGETASAIAVDFIVNHVKKGEPLSTSIASAHHFIKEESERGRGPDGMGTTVVALRTMDSHNEIAWVGDCRAYLWDGVYLTQLTKDHSYVQHLVDTGVLSANEMNHHPYQDILIQALGAKDIHDVSVDTVSHEWHQHEQILLCSDGLTKELKSDDIADVLSLPITEQEKVDSLIHMALQKGGKDNITAILISAHNTAPVKPPEQDTEPMHADNIHPQKKRFAEQLFSWLKKISRFIKK